MKDVVKKIKEYDKKKIYTCSSIYNVLLAVCIIFLTEETTDSYVVMFSPEKKIVDAFNTFKAKMKEQGIKSIVIDKHTKLHRALGLSDIENKKVIKEIITELQVGKNDFLLINFSWNQKMVRYPASMYFKRCSNAIFIEEGATQYLTPDEGIIYRSLKSLYGNQTGFWEMEKLDSLYVQRPERFPNIMQKRMKVLDLKNGIIMLSNERKHNLMDIFMKKEDKNELYVLKNMDGIIFTQPISEDGFVTEDEKIHIYANLTNFYSQYGRIALKIHPRDTSNYDIENINIIRGTYPSELLSILGIHFKFAIGLCTSAIESVEADIKMNLNEYFLKELKYDLYEL